MTVWTDFVKKYAADKGISYKAALSQASGPYKSRGETKPSEGTVQVKRNVAQRGLADIAAKQQKKDTENREYDLPVNVKKRGAKRDLREIASKAKKKAFVKATGLPEEAIQAYADYEYIYTMYEYPEILTIPAKVKKAIKRFRVVLDKIVKEIGKGNDSSEIGNALDFFEGEDRYYGYVGLEDGDEAPVFADDAVSTINDITSEAVNLLDEIREYRGD